MSNDNFMVELMKIVDKYAPIKPGTVHYKENQKGNNEKIEVTKYISQG